MQSLDDAIMQYLQKGQIDPDEAYNKCIDKSKFLPFLKKSPGDFTDV